jgi:hypothetical protein
VPVRDQTRESGGKLSDSGIQDKGRSKYYEQAQNDKWNIGRAVYSAKYDTYDTGPMPKMQIKHDYYAVDLTLPPESYEPREYPKIISKERTKANSNSPAHVKRLTKTSPLGIDMKYSVRVKQISRELEKYDMSDFKPKQLLLAKKDPRKIQDLLNSTLANSEVKESIKANNKFTSPSVRDELKNRLVRRKQPMVSNKESPVTKFARTPFEEISYHSETYNFRTEGNSARHISPAKFSKLFSPMTNSDLVTNTKTTLGQSFDAAYDGKKLAFEKNLPLNGYMRISDEQNLTDPRNFNLKRQSFQNVVNLSPNLHITNRSKRPVNLATEPDLRLRSNWLS